MLTMLTGANVIAAEIRRTAIPPTSCSIHLLQKAVQADIFVRCGPGSYSRSD